MERLRPRVACAIVVALAVTGSADALAAVEPEPRLTPLVRLIAPSATDAVVRVTTEAHDCSAPPTVRVVATYTAARPGPAALRVVGLRTLLRARPRATGRSERLRFARAARRRGPVRLGTTLVANWSYPRDAHSCYLTLPAIVGRVSIAARGVQRLRTPALADALSRPPRRTTATDLVWACSARSRRRSNCSVRVTLHAPVGTAKASEATPPAGSSQKSNDGNGLALLLGALLGGGLLVGAGAAQAVTRRKAGPMDKDQWNETAAAALTAGVDDPAPISANASALTKIGAPLAAIIGVVVAAFLGDEFGFDPKKAETVIAAGIVAATAIIGVLLVFASDFYTRGRVTAARFDALARILGDDWANQSRVEDIETLQTANAALKAEVEECTSAQEDDCAERVGAAEEARAAAEAETAAGQQARAKAEAETAAAQQARAKAEADAATAQQARAKAEADAAAAQQARTKAEVDAAAAQRALADREAARPPEAPQPWAEQIVELIKVLAESKVLTAVLERVLAANAAPPSRATPAASGRPAARSAPAGGRASAPRSTPAAKRTSAVRTGKR